MIVSRGRRYIFVHIPKTGGTSMALALEARAMKDDILIGDTPKAQRRKGRLKGLTSAGRLWKHSTLADLDGVVSGTEMDGMRVFTLIRNPWDRLVSYYHWLRAQEFDHDAVTLARTHDFAGFLRHPHTMASLKAWPYGRYVRDLTGAERPALFLRLEQLDKDMAPLAAHLGFTPDLPHVNRSDRGDYRDHYDAALADHVADLCAQDIARFGYTF
ncbi:sulfotransferase family 2 domain-containing protein [Thetidibacter halocola]|uniref:Sulfotransferase family 2 domain-containing protein n=1 Tax=Thetidibacter halocola TaxID=2827239 RepID=A0A8J7WJI2_9RHOB|nr:sulfotransferase family 2 domain-containing protein [Thetidibacter halocola]MBS0126386.1 sulfotransferase family 2 domain-containing protein [Thetidibacter halocola]